jgi:hypothetical protein
MARGKPKTPRTLLAVEAGLAKRLNIAAAQATQLNGGHIVFQHQVTSVLLRDALDRLGEGAGAFVLARISESSGIESGEKAV